MGAFVLMPLLRLEKPPRNGNTLVGLKVFSCFDFTIEFVCLHIRVRICGFSIGLNF